jgi:predicted metal-dependent enzyme (double-stranded beta helix superfamily)
MDQAAEIESFLTALRAALGGSAPRDAVRFLLEDKVRILAAQSPPWLAHESDELLLAATPEMTAYHITLTPGIHYPPHDHRMPAMIGLYRGTETSIAYRRHGDALVEERRHDHAGPCVAELPADAIHSVVNLGPAPSAAIHVYFGDLIHVARSVWDAEGRGERPFDNRFYFAQARRWEGAR